MPRQGAAPGLCTTARLYRRDPAAPRTNAHQEEAGRETSFLFKLPSHPCHRRSQVFPASTSNGTRQSARPLGQAMVGTGTAAIPAPVLAAQGLLPCRHRHTPPAPAPTASPPAWCPMAEGWLLPPTVRSPPARCLVPGAQHHCTEHPKHGHSSCQAQDPLPGTDGLFSSRAEIQGLALCFLPSAQVYFPCFLFMSWASIEFPKVIAIPCHRSRTQRLPRCQDPSFAIGPVPFPSNHCGNSLCFASGSCSSGPNQGPLSKAWVF